MERSRKSLVCLLSVICLTAHGKEPPKETPASQPPQATLRQVDELFAPWNHPDTRLRAGDHPGQNGGFS